MYASGIKNSKSSRGNIILEGLKEEGAYFTKRKNIHVKFENNQP